VPWARHNMMIFCAECRRSSTYRIEYLYTSGPSSEPSTLFMMARRRGVLPITRFGSGCLMFWIDDDWLLTCSQTEKLGYPIPILEESYGEILRHIYWVSIVDIFDLFVNDRKLINRKDELFQLDVNTSPSRCNLIVMLRARARLVLLTACGCPTCEYCGLYSQQWSQSKPLVAMTA